MITSIYASIFLATALALTGVQAASECWTNVHNSTISFSSRAAITFSYDIETATDCLNWCGRVDNCQAWLHVEHGKQCDLYHSAPLSIAPNPGFTFGGCAPSHVDEYTLVHTPIPSSTAIASNTHGATSSSILVRSPFFIFNFGLSCS